MAIRRTYLRPMEGWWRRDPYFLRYMAREATAIFVAAYALVLMVGLLWMAQGEAAYEDWRQVLRSPMSVALHVLVVAAFAYHTVTWFLIMPKTMAPVVLGGRRLPAAAITFAGIAAAIVLSIVLWLLAMKAFP